MVRFSVAALLACSVLLSGCSKDPEVAKREYLGSGDAYVEQKKYAEAVVEYRNAIQQDAEVRHRALQAGGSLHAAQSAGRGVPRVRARRRSDAGQRRSAGQGCAHADGRRAVSRRADTR